MTSSQQIRQTEFDLKGGEILLETTIVVPLFMEYSTYGTPRNAFDSAKEHFRELERKINELAPEGSDAYIRGEGTRISLDSRRGSGSSMTPVCYQVQFVRLRKYFGAGE